MNNTLKKARTHEWWKPKAGFLFALLFYIIWSSGKQFNFPVFLKLLFLSFVTLTAIGILGHLLNDLGDMESDAKAGKNNSMIALSKTNRFLVIVAVFAVAVAPWYFLPYTSTSIYLLSAEFLLLIIYPLKPLRLKQYPLVAVIADALYAFAIPAVLAFYTYQLYYELSFSSNHFLVLFAWAFFIGLRQIIYHHVSDRKNDLKSKTPNLSLAYSNYILNNFLRRYVIIPELIFGIFFFLLHYNQFPLFTCVIIVFYSCLFFPLFSLSTLKLFPQHLFGIFKPDKFYSHYFSLIILSVLSYYNIWFISVLFLVLLLFTSIRKHFIVHYVLNDLLKKNIMSMASSMVNNSIYYFRKCVLIKDEKASRAEHYEEWREEQARKKNGTIALVNANENKYTETFVRQHEKLPFKIHYYFGNNFPLWHYGDGNLISNNKGIYDFKRVLSQWLQQNEEDYNLKILAQHLQKNRIQLILCEFGTTGAKLAQLPELTGIPLAVIFYGYDAHHKAIVEQNQEKYAELFTNASVIIVVSKDILLKLKSLGAPDEKLVYLPCSFDINLFQYSDHSGNKPVFLSVGRFAETKAPHLTILAFNEVLKQVPEARLIMVGKDGGGELFEACHILVKALGIENKILFKGILSPEQVFEEMKNAYAFIQHSLTTPIHGDKEGTPVAVMEAMVCGLPVIATRHAGIAEIVEHEKTGLLVDEYDYRKMAEEMIRIAADKKFAQQLGFAASESIKNNPLFLATNQALTEIIDKHKLK